MRISLAGPINRPLGPLWCGLAAGAVFLSRLDTIMFVGLYSLWFLFVKRCARDALIFAAALLAFVAPYLVSNMVWFGGLMPVSGWMKSSFPHIVAKGFGNAGLAKSLWGCNIAFSLMPTALAAPALVWARRTSAESRHFAVALWGGCALQLGYLALFTRSHTEWYWYSVLPMMLGGLTTSIVLREISERWLLGRPSAPMLAVASRVGLALLAVAWIATTVRMRWHHEPLPLKFRAELDYMAEHRVEGASVLVGDFPGYLAFLSTNNCIVAADLLTGSRPFYEAMRGHSNALEFMRDYCRQQGLPLRMIVFLRADRWLVPDEDLRAVTYNDPRTYPRLTPIGRLSFPNGPAKTLWVDGELMLAIWDLQDQPSADDTTERRGEEPKHSARAGP